jgi:hypothetical protein
MDIVSSFYPSDLIPAAANTSHGYQNFWVRDGYYVGLCSPAPVRDRIWQGMIGILDRYRWKLEIHAKKQPQQWWEYMHIRYSPDGKEIAEHWLHNQFDAYANWGEVCLDCDRLDLAELLVDYLQTIHFHRKPAAGAWEDRNSCDAYSLAACVHFLQRAKNYLPHKAQQIERMVKMAVKRLYALLPYATTSKVVCLSLLGVLWPFDLAGPYRQEIIDKVATMRREPFGFIRYKGDAYSGHDFSRTEGTEVPWLLGDCFMALIEPRNPIWRQRLDAAQQHFNCMPEAYFPETMKPNRNTPLLWAEAMYNKIQS